MHPRHPEPVSVCYGHRPATAGRQREGSTGRTATSHRWAAAGALAALALLGTGCGGDDDTETVTAADYQFKNLPSSVKAGTTLTLKNDSDKEIHEMVISRLPDGETRSAEELVGLPDEQLEAPFLRPAGRSAAGVSRRW